jgi:hypothetical protein
MRESCIDARQHFGMPWLAFKAKHRPEKLAAAYRAHYHPQRAVMATQRRNNAAATIATVNAPTPTTNTENHRSSPMRA